MADEKSVNAPGVNAGPGTIGRAAAQSDPTPGGVKSSVHPAVAAAQPGIGGNPVGRPVGSDMPGRPNRETAAEREHDAKSFPNNPPPSMLPNKPDPNKPTYAPGTQRTGLVKVRKGRDTIEVHHSTLGQHLDAGWVEVDNAGNPVEFDASGNPVVESTSGYPPDSGWPR